MAISQENRMLQIETVLGADRLILTSVTSTDAISAPFSYWLDLISESRDIAPEDLIGTDVTFSITLANGQQRYYNGIVNRFMRAESTRRGGDEVMFYANYKAEVVPWLLSLSRNSNCRIFQNKTVPQIIEQIFRDRSVTDYEMSLSADYPTREYCVQYRESDYDFIYRLMSYEGIFYFFTHEDGSHRMVIADSGQSVDSCPNQETARFSPVATTGVSEEDVVTDLQNTASPLSGRYVVNDYNFKTPNADLSAQVDSTCSYGQTSDEIYDYPAVYTVKADGDRIVNIRIQQQEVRAKTISGISNCRAFACGTKFGLEEHPDSGMNIDYLLTSMHIVTSEPAGDTEQFGTAVYENRFTCIPMEVPFRPPLIKTKQSVPGIQTAFVVGPQGEEIYTDKYGRIKVQFHWDRLGQKNENSSCFMRVAQTIAGASFGHVFIPRIGQEVIISFIEGDPDRPVVTGCLYNEINMPPYSLPGEKTKSTVKTNSSLGGGGFNEFRFEDKKGSEEIYLQGEKDWNILIKNDKSQTIGHDETLAVGNNRTKTVGVNQSETIGQNKTINVGMDHTEMIGKNMTLTVTLNKTETVGVNTAETIGAAKELSIGANYQVSVGAVMNEDVGGQKTVGVAKDSYEKIGGNKTVDVAKDSSEKVDGKKAVNVTKEYSLKGKKILLTADEEVTIKAGSAQIVMKKSGDITIKGKKITVSGSSDVIVKGSKITQN
ncbi:MAG: type VI secretion system tip protein TssI/VgrG [Syntrophaceae bacterium]